MVYEKMITIFYSIAYALSKLSKTAKEVDTLKLKSFQRLINEVSKARVSLSFAQRTDFTELPMNFFWRYGRK